jgi:hypothetical protein
MSKKSHPIRQWAPADSASGKDAAASRDAAPIVFLGIVFLFSCIRAAKLSLVHDEAITYFIQLPLSFWGIFTFDAGIWMPNNHFLNSALIKILTHFLGPSEFVIRMPALMGHALYLFGAYKISRLFLKGAPLFIGLALLTLNPFTMDFFSCARGYGLGLGFMMSGLYFFFRAPRNTFFCASLLAMAVFSQLTFLMIFAATVTVLFLIEMSGLLRLMKKTPSDSLFVKQFFKRIFLPIAPGVVFLTVIYAHPLKTMLTVNDHFHAGLTSGNQGFWQDTVRSLIDATLYGKAYPVAGLHNAAMFFIGALLLGAASYLIAKRTMKAELKPSDKILFWCLGLMVVLALSIVMQHFFSGKEYVTDRWVIYFIPLFMLFAIVFWQCCRGLASKAFRVTANAVFYSTAPLFIFHCLSCSNLSHFYTWKYDASTRDMVQQIVEMNNGKNLPENSVLVGSNILFAWSFNYYINKGKLWWIRYIDSSGPDGLYDYYCLFPDDKPLIDKYGLTVIKNYDLSGAILARP